MISVCISNELEKVNRLYKECGYEGEASDADSVLVAEDNGRMIGAVRLCTEKGECLLRGMYILPEYQKQGVGSLMLESFKAELGKRECWCLPLVHLKKFYEQIGFKLVDPIIAPAHLRARLDEYLVRHPGGVCIMKLC